MTEVVELVTVDRIGTAREDGEAILAICDAALDRSDRLHRKILGFRKWERAAPPIAAFFHAHRKFCWEIRLLAHLTTIMADQPMYEILLAATRINQILDEMDGDAKEYNPLHRMKNLDFLLDRGEYFLRLTSDSLREIRDLSAVLRGERGPPK